MYLCHSPGSTSAAEDKATCVACCQHRSPKCDFLRMQASVSCVRDVCVCTVCVCRVCVYGVRMCVCDVCVHTVCVCVMYGVCVCVCVCVKFINHYWPPGIQSLQPHPSKLTPPSSPTTYVLQLTIHILPPNSSPYHQSHHHLQLAPPLRRCLSRRVPSPGMCRVRSPVRAQSSGDHMPSCHLHAHTHRSAHTCAHTHTHTHTHRSAHTCTHTHT